MTVSLFMPFYYYFDPTYILVIIGMVIVLAASGYMRRTYAKYSQIQSSRNITGEMASRLILRSEQIGDVQIKGIAGELTDNYNPKDKTLNLSETSRNDTSIAAIGVAAHECGHAIQDKQGYWALQLRSFLVPITNIGAKLSWPIIFIGVILSWNQTLINIGIYMFMIVFFFQLVTLPVEFNASSRAIKALETNNVLTQEELVGTKKVLRAAALTYVASAASTLLQLVRLLTLFGGRRNRD